MKRMVNCTNMNTLIPWILVLLSSYLSTQQVFADNYQPINSNKPSYWSHPHFETSRLVQDKPKSKSDSTWRARSNICNKPGVQALGMQSGAIKNEQISASSTYNEQSVGPKFARLNRDESGGAWCPKEPLNYDKSGFEWIQVNLTERFVITAIATQGRFGNGHGLEFCEEYYIEYSRDYGLSWAKWKNSKGQTHLKGNNDSYSNVTNTLDIPIVGANVVRIYPFAKHSRTVCLRFELFGCPYKDGPLSYSMPDGAFGGRYGDLIDDSYDGIRDSRKYLSGGLGQLVDGIKAHENYKVNSGYEWIGWEAENETVEIIFEFGELRNFSSAMLHTHNLVSKDIEVFSCARIYFSYDGRKWSKNPLELDYQPDHTIESPRDVIINLGNKVSKFIKFSLKFASKLLLISEVKFNSFPVSGDDYAEIMDDLESLEVTSNSVEPRMYQDSQSTFDSTVLIVICGLTGLALIAVISVLAYRRYLGGQGKTDHFYPVDINYLDSLGVAGKGVTTPVYCDPDEINNYQHNNHLGGSNHLHHNHHNVQPNQRFDHEYAVPDVVYQNGLSSGPLSKTAKHLITNPLSNIEKFVKETNYNNYSKTNDDLNDLKPLAEKGDHHEPTLIKVGSNGGTIVTGINGHTNDIAGNPIGADDDDDDNNCSPVHPIIDINHMYLLKGSHHHNNSFTSGSNKNSAAKYGTVATATQRLLTPNVNKQQRHGYRAVHVSTQTRRGERRT